MMRFGRTRDLVEVEPPPIPHSDGILQICHPDWRGVRSSAAAFRDPVMCSDDLATLASRVAEIAGAGADTVVIQGWPPGAATFARAASAHGLVVHAVSHSAPTQHGVDAGEVEAFTEMLHLKSEGVIMHVGVVKAGVREAFATLGHDLHHVPNRVPDVGRRQRRDPIGGDTNAGVFLHPMWRKNVTTQLLAIRQCGWTAHVMTDPAIPYLDSGDIVIHGELARDRFLDVVEAMTIMFNVTLSECHPMMPMESYRLGVPCLVSRTSDLFTEDAELYALTTVDRADDPGAIASAATHLLDRSGHAVELANRALDTIDARGEARWLEFTGRTA
jgi:hypothetical protein